MVQCGTGLTLFFRYVAGNVIDVSTATYTIAELRGMGVDTRFAILDAGYHANDNADAPVAAKVSFLIRMKPNLAPTSKTSSSTWSDSRAGRTRSCTTAGSCT